MLSATVACLGNGRPRLPDQGCRTPRTIGCTNRRAYASSLVAERALSGVKRESWSGIIGFGKRLLLGQRPEGRDSLRLIRLRLRYEGQGITKALPAGESRLEAAEWPLSPAEHVTNEPLRWTGPTTPRFWRRLFARANLRWYLSSKGVLRGCSAVAVASERYWLSRTRISVVVVRGFWMSG